MITIYKPERVNMNGKARLQARIDGLETGSLLWFETSKKYGPYMTTERSDAFLVGLLWPALKHGQDVRVIGTLSEKLFYSLNHHLIPLIAQMYGYKPIKVNCDNLDFKPLPNAGAVGTGLSCGIDSLITVCLHQKNDIPPHYKITHFTYFNVGSNHLTGSGRLMQRKFQGRLAISSACAAELGKELIVVDSNLSDIMKMSFVTTHTLRSISAVLLFQKLFHVYYYASSIHTLQLQLNEFSISGEYDVIILPLLSTENVTFYSGGSNYTRVQKTQMVADFAPSYKYLNVCIHHINNCGKCMKCKRTLLTLDILGAIHKYENVFNLQAFYTVKDAYVKDVIQRREDPFLKEIYDEMVRTNYLDKLEGSDFSGT